MIDRSLFHYTVRCKTRAFLVQTQDQRRAEEIAGTYCKEPVSRSGLATDREFDVFERHGLTALKG